MMLPPSTEPIFLFIFIFFDVSAAVAFIAWKQNEIEEAPVDVIAVGRFIIGFALSIAL